jgi:hypothetical protein
MQRIALHYRRYSYGAAPMEHTYEEDERRMDERCRKPHSKQLAQDNENRVPAID